ncbi:phosphotransferase [Streptomyces lanatus]|uniref:Phosphotransferase n=1 Tax=Streptomyces lanatus TaxID=66900 RepID=A0ABV1XL98_9ACTN|nr:phosphotransferase [Streptomyces lanatus]GHG98644.1 aminoglycoside phosphotransferase [Streptomyces lanatus]
MEPPELGRAIEAAQATASRLGLQAGEATIIHNSDRVVLRLDPCAVLARVAPSEHLAGSEFEVEVARRLTAAGAPVAELEPRTAPQVHVRDGFAVSLWTYYEPVRTPIAPADYADALMRHHAALRQTELDAPHVTDRIAGALSEVDDRARSPELPDSEREFLRSTLRGLSTALSTERAADQLLHGEPHPGNLLNTRRGPLFVDLATCCRGPVEFDLAHAPENVAQHYPRADHTLTRQCRALNWAMFSAWRWRRTDQMPHRDHWRTEGLNRTRAALQGREPH